MRRSLVLLCVAWLAGLPTVASAQPSPTPPSPAFAAQPLAREDVETILATLRGAADQGFGTAEFGIGDAERQLASVDPAVRAGAEARIEAAAVAYARAQHGLRIPSSSFPFNWAIRPAPYDAAADFAAALAQHRLAAWAVSLPPPDPRYAALARAYARYNDMAGRGGWDVIPKGPSLKPGAKGPRVTALRRRLAAEDPAVVIPSATDAAAAADVYDSALADAVARAQARYGLTPDGVAGPATLQALNVPIEVRLDQIRANLERWRWMPRRLPSLRLELNIAAQTLEAFEGDEPPLAMKAIVGKPSKPTPMFQDEVEAIVFNPPWNVPRDIAVKEIWPKIRRDRGYMAREGFVVKPDGSLQQRPGPKCALGSIKFDLPNRFGVYLHDTPARSLFARDTRTLSHGCMRLEHPGALARRLLQGLPGWDDSRVEEAVESGVTQRIELPRHVPVFVVYRSVFVDADGQVNFRADVYRWDAKLMAML